ncbi:MAG: HAMP domain-containing histidine kinase [Chloroflexi bacterium]|nr:HAMP domain-containing histidine kinase [Chloroflexota bacterium]
MLMALVFATSAPTRRVAFVSVGLAVAGLIWMASRAPADTINQYVFIGLAGTFAAMGMSTLMRGVVHREVRARLASDALNADLERELRENQRLQAKTQALALSAHAANRAKTDFLATMSHEIRTPLNGVLGMAQIMAAGDLDPEQKRRLAIISDSGQSLLGVINAILDISRIEAGRVRAHYAPVDLATYSAEIASSFRSVIEKAGLRLDIQAKPLPHPVYIDPEMWEKVLLNLLSNAFKFTLEGQITLSVEPARDGRSVQVRVSDTGIGVPVEEMPKLFERFHRVEGAQGRSVEGSGIGLALVSELVRLHGGHIAAHSVEGEGTTFVVTLPLGYAHLPADQVRPETTRAPASRVGDFLEEAARWLRGDVASR